MRGRVRKLLARTEDDMTDVELMGRGSDDFHFIAFCLDMQRLPSEVEHTIGCREYTRVKAHGLVRRAMDDLQRAWQQEAPHASGSL